MKYKTAEQLAITEPEHRVLLMAKDWLTKNDQSSVAACPIEGNGRFEFYMGRTLNNDYKPKLDCKSQGCIWGLCHILAAVNKIDAFETSPYGKNHTRGVGQHDVSPVLDRLFFPHRENPLVDYGHVTPAMAAEWIEAWMTTGTFDTDLLFSEDEDEAED